MSELTLDLPPLTDTNARAVCEALLKAPNAHKHIDARTRMGYTSALAFCAARGLTHTTKYLLESKASVTLPPLFPGQATPLIQALHATGFKVAKLLVAAGACTHPIAVWWRDSPIRLSDKDMHSNSPASFRKWMQSVETPLVGTCDNCGTDLSPEGIARVKKSYEEHTARVQ